jgi:hypothetical protein
VTDLPLVTCVLLTYNFERFLARSIESVLAQDWPADRLQVVVVDDGSTDSTPEVVRPYLDRIEYVRKANGGIVDATNAGLAVARGELIAHHSGDDEWTPWKVRTQAELLASRPEVGLVYGDSQVVDAEGALLHESFWAMAGVSPCSGRVLGTLMRRNVVSGGTMMWRASLRERVAPLPGAAAWEDWWIALRVAEVAEIAPVSRPMLRYRFHGTNHNLGAGIDRQVANARAELPLRRLLLHGLDTTQAAPGDLAEACRMLVDGIAHVARHTGEDPRAIAGVSEVDGEASARMLAAAEQALALGDARGALRSAAAALGHDPHDERARALVPALAQVLTPPPDVRGFLVLADAHELARRPELLSAYGSAFDGADDATLVAALAPDDPSAAVAALTGAVAAAGLDGEDAADIWAGCVGRDDPRVLVALAVLGEGPAGLAPALPRFGAHEMASLRALADAQPARG